MGHPTPAEAVYVYGIVRSGDARRVDARGLGEPPRRLAPVRHSDVAALVTPVPAPTAPAGQADLLAHARALEAVVARVPVLPMRFGMTLPDGDAVARQLLAAHYERWDALLDAFRDTVELSVKVFADEAAELARVVEQDPGVRRLRHAAAWQERVRLGQLAAEALERRRQAAADWVVGRLAPHARQVRARPPALAGMVVEAAFLVARDAVEAFDREAAALAAEAGERLRLRCLGPQPPYTFVSEGG